MQDEETRGLERALRGGDKSARSALTTSMLRSKSGRVLFWRDTAAAPVPMAQQASVATVLRPGRFAATFKGHALAVLDLDDLYLLARSEPGVWTSPPFLFDLASGESFEVFCPHSAERERAEHERRTQAEARRRGLAGEVSGGPIFARPRDEPLFDRIVLKPDRHQARFFQVPLGGKDEDGNVKTHADTNLYGYGSSLPRGHYYKATGLSVIPDSGAAAADLAALRDRGLVRILLGCCPLSDWPGRLAIPQTADGAGQDGANPLFAPPMIALTRPFELAETENFAVEILADPSVAARVGPVPLMAILHGIHLKPLSG